MVDVVPTRFLRSMHGRCLAAAAIAAIALGSACVLSSDPRPRGTLEEILALRERDDVNVLFILVDTLRADHLDFLGYGRETSPNLARLAKTGILFSGHVAQSSWTKCSMASLWTGLYPNRTRVLRAQNALPEAARLPAEIFRDAGFRTAGIFRNGWVAANFGFSQGFEIYQMPPPRKYELAAQPDDPAKVPGSDADVIRSASEFLRAHAGERWFLYLHLLDVHQYSSDESSAVFGTRWSDLYDNAILWTDTLVGHLLDELDRRGLRDRTLVVFASDHGEAFGEHGGEGHARNVYGEVTETPFFLSFPFRLEPGIIVDSESENVDIWPTILDLLGLVSLQDSDGQSLVPAIRAAAAGEARAEPAPLAFAQIDKTWGQLEAQPRQTVAVTQGSWRLVYDEARSKRPELFDQVADPRERRNVAKDHPEIAQRLSDAVSDYLKRSNTPWGESPVIEIDKMELNQLRAIGYGVQ